MHESGLSASAGAGWDEQFISAVSGVLEQFSAVSGVLEQFGSPDPQVLAEVVLLNLNHPLWAVWLPVSGRGWVAARPAGSRPPGPEMPMLWVIAESAADLSARMRRADAALLPPG